MSMIAHKIVENKFWTLEENGQKIAYIEATPAGYNLHRNDVKNALKQELFKSINDIQSKYDIKFNNKDTITEKDSELNVNGYPVKSFPYNKVYDMRRKLPMFTKTPKSKSYHCAGYYIVKFENIDWIVSYNPKLITVSKYAYRGPFFNVTEAKHERIIVQKEEKLNKL